MTVPFHARANTSAAWGVITAGHAVAGHRAGTPVPLANGSRGALLKSYHPPIDAAFVGLAAGAVPPPGLTALALRSFPAAGQALDVHARSGAVPRTVVSVSDTRGVINTRYMPIIVFLDLPLQPGETVEKGKTRLLGNRLRILQGQIVVADRPLTIIASHWSSRLSDKTGATRGQYADLIYGHFKGAYIANPKIDFLVCGDFNDNPDDESVTAHLRATGDADAVRAGGDEPKLFDLMASLWQNKVASIYNRATPYLFDQICVSPGLLDEEGWSVVPDTARVVPQMAQGNGRPNRFGGPKDKRSMTARGASDHFPVVVRLRVR